MKPLALLLVFTASIAIGLTAEAVPSDPLSFETIAAVVPANVGIKRGTKPDAVGIALANVALKQLIGKQAALDVVVDKMTPTASTRVPILVRSRQTQVTFGNTKLPCTVFTYVLAKEVATLGNVKKATPVKVIGKVIKAEIGKNAELIIDLDDADVKLR